MTDTRLFKPADSTSKRVTSSSRSPGRVMPAWARALAPTTLSLLFLGGCVDGTDMDREGAGEEVEEAVESRPDSSATPVKPPCPDEECFGITCPDGFSRVGSPDARGSYCITQQQGPAVTFLQAMTECFTMDTSTGAVPHLCTMEEWYIACSQGADLGEDSIDDTTNGWEWVEDALEKNRAMVMGKGACGATGISATSAPRPFRCCVS